MSALNKMFEMVEKLVDDLEKDLEGKKSKPSYYNDAMILKGFLLGMKAKNEERVVITQEHDKKPKIG